MNSLKIIFGVSLIAFCYVCLSSSLKCYVCDNKSSCKAPRLLQCNQRLANITTSYLHLYHIGVGANITSSNFACFEEYLHTTSQEIYQKGCIYSNMSGCNYHLSPYITSTLKESACTQCSNKDGCNPAGRVTINMITIFTTFVVAAILRC